MNNVQRFCQVLNLFDQGYRMKFCYSSLQDDCIYAMSEDGNIGYNSNTNSDSVIATNYSYDNWLTVCSDGMRTIYKADVFELVMNIPNNNSIPAICITTNGDLNKAGECVMGKGNALAFKQVFPGIQNLLGKYIKEYGNRVFNLGVYNYNNIPVRVISFPTKHHWKEDSDINLIKKSCEEIIQVCDKFKIETVLLPAPGVNNGNLNYDAIVKPVLELSLDDRFYVCFK